MIKFTNLITCFLFLTSVVANAQPKITLDSSTNGISELLFSEDALARNFIDEGDYIGDINLIR